MILMSVLGIGLALNSATNNINSRSFKALFHGIISQLLK
jgi:hypothetical protein